MDYKQYTNSEINKLNKSDVWYRTPINVEKNSQESKSQKNQTYILHATGDCDMNGRRYIALPSDCNHNSSEIKKKYNLM